MQPHAFRGLLQGISGIAGITHVSFLLIFFWAGVDALAFGNIASVLCYALTFVLARRGHIALSFLLIVVEVVAHAVLATLVIGWNSGFHHYILLVIPVTVVSPIRPLWIKAASVLAEALGYMALDFFLRRGAAPHELPGHVLEALYYFNVFGTLLILTFLAGSYYYLINQAQAALRQIADTDPLTQLRNRRSLLDAIRHEEHRLERSHAPLSFVMCDLDHFKTINDTLGHEAGDTVLKAVSATLAHCARASDLIGRWGGEEFLLVLPDTDKAGAMDVAERLRQAVESLQLTAAGEPLKVTMTLGVATMEKGGLAEHAIGRADGALYEGKRHGRNRVTAA